MGSYGVSAELSRCCLHYGMVLCLWRSLLVCCLDWVVAFRIYAQGASAVRSLVSCLSRLVTCAWTYFVFDFTNCLCDVARNCKLDLSMRSSWWPTGRIWRARGRSPPDHKGALPALPRSSVGSNTVSLLLRLLPLVLMALGDSVVGS